MDQDILIVGGGIFGTSTAYHLSASRLEPDGKNVSQPRITILDQGPRPPALAASTDINKIVRADYSSRFYMDLGAEAIEAWDAMPLFRDADVYHRTGWVMLGEKGNELARRIRDNFKASGRQDVTKDMTLDEVRTQWGGMLKDTDMDDFEHAYFNPLAGWADAARAVEVMLDEAVARGVRYEVGTADRLILGQSGVRGVQTVDGRLFTAGKVLLATGAWTSSLMSTAEDELDIPEVDRMERQVTAAGVAVAHIRLSAEEQRLYDQIPVVVSGEQGETIPPTRDQILKFTNSLSFKNTVKTVSGHEISVPPEQDQAEVPAAMKQEFHAIIRKRFPRLLDDGRKVDYWRICWDSISPDQNQLVTQHPHPRLHNLYFAVAGSFHSFKFLPTIGKYVVNVLRGIGNGSEKDRAWAWKTPEYLRDIGPGAHEGVVPHRELRDLE